MTPCLAVVGAGWLEAFGRFLECWAYGDLDLNCQRPFFDVLGDSPHDVKESLRFGRSVSSPSYQLSSESGVIGK